MEFHLVTNWKVLQLWPEFEAFLANEIFCLTADHNVCHSSIGPTKVFVLSTGRAVEVNAGPSLDSATVSYSNEEISHKTRRQMYINAANLRMKCTVHRVCQCETQSLNSSRESLDTIDNERYSTDTSFIDQVVLNSMWIQGTSALFTVIHFAFLCLCFFSALSTLSPL
jgi:hypothetical protein